MFHQHFLLAVVQNKSVCVSVCVHTYVRHHIVCAPLLVYSRSEANPLLPHHEFSMALQPQLHTLAGTAAPCAGKRSRAPQSCFRRSN